MVSACGGGDSSGAGMLRGRGVVARRVRGPSGRRSVPRVAVRRVPPARRRARRHAAAVAPPRAQHRRRRPATRAAQVHAHIDVLSVYFL